MMDKKVKEITELQKELDLFYQKCYIIYQKRKRDNRAAKRT